MVICAYMIFALGMSSSAVIKTFKEKRTGGRVLTKKSQINTLHEFERCKSPFHQVPFDFLLDLASIRQVFFKESCPYSFEQLTAIEQKVRPVEPREEARSIHTLVLSIFTRIEALHNHKKFSTENILKSFTDMDDSVFQKKFDKKLETKLQQLKEKINSDRMRLMSSIDDIRFLAQLLLDFLEGFGKPVLSESTIIEIFEEENIESEVEEEKEEPQKGISTLANMSEALKSSFAVPEGDQQIMESVLLNGKLNAKKLKKLKKSEFYLIHRIAKFFRTMLVKSDKEHPQEKLISWVELGIGRFAIALLHKRDKTDLLFIKRTLLSCDFKAQKSLHFLFLLIKAFVLSNDFSRIVDNYQVENAIFSNLTQIHKIKTEQKTKKKKSSLSPRASSSNASDDLAEKLKGFNQHQQNLLGEKKKTDASILDNLEEKEEGNKENVDLPPLKNKKK